VTYNRNTIYTLNFRCDHTVPTNGYISVTIPDDITLNTSSARSNGSCGTFSCSLSSDEKTISFKSTLGELPGETDLTIQIGGVTNARSTRTSGLFSISTYDTDQTSLIDEGSDMTVQMTIPGELNDFSVVPTNTTNGALTTYTYSFSTSIPIEDGDVISFTVPDQIENPSSSSSADC